MSRSWKLCPRRTRDAEDRVRILPDRVRPGPHAAGRGGAHVSAGRSLPSNPSPSRPPQAADAWATTPTDAPGELTAVEREKVLAVLNSEACANSSVTHVRRVSSTRAATGVRARTMYRTSWPQPAWAGNAAARPFIRHEPSRSWSRSAPTPCVLGTSRRCEAARQRVLDEAHAAHPERFHRRPQAPGLNERVTINDPANHGRTRGFMNSTNGLERLICRDNYRIANLLV